VYFAGRLPIKQIQTIGNYLSTYSTDLNYIKMFQYFKENKISASYYVKKDIGTFYSFLIEFRVVRNFSHGAVDKLLDETLVWINSSGADNVDLFADNLATKGLTRGKIMTSLASKILFLNNPWKIIPMDTLARRALKQKENKYSIYDKNLNVYRQTKRPIIENLIQYTKPLTTIIDNEYKGKLKDIDVISENRIVDKLLWTSGK
jgi:hypothetical protein